MYVWMWCKIRKDDIVCTIGNSLCMLLRNFRREKTLGEMWAAVIKTINNLLWMGWLRTRPPPSGDRAGASRCSEGDHEGHIREVPQEEHSPSMYIAQIMCTCKEEFQLTANLSASIAGKLTSWKSQWLRCWRMRELLVTANILFWPFPMYKYVMKCVV